MEIDSQEFNQIFSEYRARYIRFAESYLKDRFLAEDLYVDSMMTFWQNRQSLPQDTNAPAYVLRTLQNKCIDYLRRRRLDQSYCEKKTKAEIWELDFRISSLEKFVPEEVFRHEVEKIIRDTVAELSEETRRVFVLSRRDGKSGKEISQILGITEKGVEYHITKANKLLRIRLKDYLTVSLIIFFLL